MNRKHFYSNPERVYQAVIKAFEAKAGANGIIISLEYNEMCVENLQAVGCAGDKN